MKKLREAITRTPKVGGGDVVAACWGGGGRIFHQCGERISSLELWSQSPDGQNFVRHREQFAGGPVGFSRQKVYFARSSAGLHIVQW